MRRKSRQVRAAEPSDARAIAEVHVASWLVAYRGQMPDEVLDALDVDERTARWERNLADPLTDETFVLEDDGVVVGFAGVGRSRNNEDRTDPTCGELYAIYLHPDHWRRGAGRFLMDHAVQRLCALGYRDATLWVLESNERARRFYEAMGWRFDGTAKLWSPGEGQPGIPEVRYHRDLP